MHTERPRTPTRVSIRNIGGIAETSVEFAPGVTVLRGRNATNRTSLLQGMMAALGSRRVSLKADAVKGVAELELGAETYERELVRTDGEIRFDGDPYLDDPELAELFAFLLESNEARRAIVTEQDLREIIMRPVDVAEIQAGIERAQSRKREIDEEFEVIDSLEAELPELEEQRGELESEIESTRAELAGTEETIEETDLSLEQGLAQSDALESKLDELSSLRTDLEDARHQLETERESIDALTDEQAAVEDELEDLQDRERGELVAIEREIRSIRERKRSVDGTMQELRHIVQFNRDVMDGDREAITTLREDTSRDPTEKLTGDGESVTCWTCGSDVELEAIREMTDGLREIVADHRDERSELDRRLRERQERHDELREIESQIEELDARKSQIETELSNRRDRIEALEATKTELSAEISALESEVRSLESEEYERLLSLHREANELEFEIERLEENRRSVVEEIESIEDRLAERDALEAEREGIVAELTELRTRIERLESEAVEEFNDQMATILDRLEYENIERIWLERKEPEESGAVTSPSAFDLHVVRSGESGTFEDTIAHLSESEREVTGLVFALAGYLVHDVHEEVPFMLLDSLEAIDADRISRLVSYFSEYAEYVVVALLPEDARALDDEYRRITEI